MILWETSKVLNLILFGSCTAVFFMRLLGKKPRKRIAMLAIPLYLVLIDYLLLEKLLRSYLVSRVQTDLQYYMIYFLQMSLSIIGFTLLVIALFKGDVLKKIAVTSIFFVTWQMVEFTITPVFCRIADLIAMDKTGLSAMEACPGAFITMGTIRYLLLCLLLLAISKHCSGLCMDLPRKISILIMVPSLFILAVLQFILLVCSDIQVFGLLNDLGRTGDVPLLYETLDVFTVLVFAIFGLAADLMVVFGVNNAMKQLLSAQHLELQVKHYKDLELGNQQLRRVKHDMKNHLLTLSGLLDGNNLEAVKEYVSDLNEESGLLTQGIESGKNAVDALLCAKQLFAQRLEVQFRCEIQFPPTLAINDFDLCVILGNAIDNGLEACQRIQNKHAEKFIAVQSGITKNYFILQIKNSSEEQSLSQDSLLSKKEDDQWHGIGLNNIKTTLDKNQGIMEIDINDYIFSLSLMFPIDRS